MTRFSVLGIASAVALAAAVVFAQQAAAPPADQQPQPRPTFKTGTNYVRVDAFATKNGAPVTDLGAGDFELLEDGVPQKIDAFEYVRVQPAGPQSTRIEPRSQQEGNDMAADPRRRVFVVYLDVDFVPVEGSARLRTALAQFLSQVIGQDDLFAITTSKSDVMDLVFARKTQYIEEQLDKLWYWGRRDTILLTPEEDNYENCYKGRYEGGEEIANEMIDRRREVATIRVMEDLVQHLRGVREERKAVLVVSTGWRLFRENPSLARVLKDPVTGRGQIPGPAPMGLGPGGKIVSGQDPNYEEQRYGCEKDRAMLAQLDDWRTFQEMLRDANRSNVSFYPIDPRGLVVFDNPIGPRTPPPPSEDFKQLSSRQDNIRWMATETDGLAVINQTDLQKGFRQIAADLTSYYLMGYYSSNTALDGKYRRITVRVKRPGVEIRARKGYRAASREDVARGAALSAAVATPGEAPEKLALTQALGRLSLIRPDAQMALFATSTPSGDLWIAGELPSAAARTPAWARGGTASMIVTSASGQTIGLSKTTIPAGSRGFLARAALDSGGGAPARVQVRVEPNSPEDVSARSSGLIDPSTVTAQVAVVSGEPLLLRKQGALAPKPVADFRFFRTEDLVFRDPVDAKTKGGSAQVLDQKGQPMTALPVSVSLESGADGTWLTGALRLAPLTSGDYVLEITRDPGGKVLVPFRVTR